MNSYIQAFGTPEGEISSHLEEVSCNLMNALDYTKCGTKDDTNLKAFKEVLAEVGLPISDNDKAHILDECFHNANENFYELEDEGIINSSADLQDTFLRLVVEAIGE
jgi:hypothetical protein